MSLTKKHFQMAAQMLREIENEKERLHIARFLVSYFMQINARFDVRTFLPAANISIDKFYE